MAPLKFYNDILSQPVRAVWMFLKLNNIPFEDVKVSLFKGEHKKEAYLSKFPQGKVPAMEDDGFVLTESVAMLQYLCAKYSDKVSPHWYPTDIKKRARVNEFLNWQHTNIRKCGVTFFVTKVVIPLTKKVPADAEKVKQAEVDLANTLDFIENNFLKTTEFVAGDDLTIADLLCIVEVMQPVAGGFDVKKGRPKLTAWMGRVQKQIGPLFDEAHKPIIDFAKDFAK